MTLLLVFCLFLLLFLNFHLSFHHHHLLVLVPLLHPFLFHLLTALQLHLHLLLSLFSHNFIFISSPIFYFSSFNLPLLPPVNVSYIHLPLFCHSCYSCFPFLSFLLHFNFFNSSTFIFSFFPYCHTSTFYYIHYSLSSTYTHT